MQRDSVSAEAAAKAAEDAAEDARADLVLAEAEETEAAEALAAVPAAELPAPASTGHELEGGEGEHLAKKPRYEAVDEVARTRNHTDDNDSVATQGEEGQAPSAEAMDGEVESKADEEEKDQELPR